MNPEFVRLELIKALLQYRPGMFVEDIGDAVAEMEAAVYADLVFRTSTKHHEVDDEIPF